MTRVAIVKTGAPPPDLAARHGGYPAMFGALLGAGYEIETFDAQAGERPDAATFDAAIITGSPAGVYEAEPWIGELLDWIRDAKARTGLIGVCFGHQAMAQALGGRVEKSDRGWGVGLHRYDVRSIEPWMTPEAATVAIPASHQDQVVEKPTGARVLLGSAFTPFAGLAWDADAISFQGHPEFTPAYAADLTGSRRDRIGAVVTDRALDSLTGPDDRAVVGEWMRRFIGSRAGR
ncbi:MAG: type 1 glutamine amidotransferase [Pseudomonadota bacterium]|nr:type 1 glutamine amidotransferase [Pseudomonadota bacterium]